MKRLSLFAVALAVVAAGCSKSSTSPSTTTPTKPTFTAALSTANEVPPITNAESGGRGDATITFDGPRDGAGNFTGPVSVTFVVNLSGFPAATPINIAHIHTGAAGATGSVLVSTTLAAGEVTTNSAGVASFTKVAPGVDAAVAQGIVNNPAGFYFNAHSTLNGGGVVRGQLVKVS
jgi:CHRD domain